MGWQDRDYARATPYYGPLRARLGHRLLWGGSIVNTLIAVNVAVFMVGWASPAADRFLGGHQQVTPRGLEIRYGWAELVPDAVMHGQVWRLVTAQYLHAGLEHIFINMLVLHFLGRPLERLWSPRKFFTIYTLCGLAGNVFYTILASRGVIPGWMPAVGASGSIYGLLGIVAVLFPTATVYVYFLFPVRIRTAAFVFAGIAFLTILRRGHNYGGEACHLAGLVFGVWWAIKGDTWWSRTEWRVPWRSDLFRRSRPRGFTERIARRADDAETIDRILKKVYDGGIHSLTEAEKLALREATERQRGRESGRFDGV